MMRRWLTIAAIAVGLALPALAFARAPVTQIQVKDNFYTPENPAARAFQTGPSFHWARAAGSGGAHNIVQDAGLFRSGGLTSGPINFSDQRLGWQLSLLLPASRLTGRGHGRCGEGRDPSRMPPRLGNPFTVIWADSGTKTGKAFDVRYKVGAGPWKIWKNDTAQFKAIFGLQQCCP